MSFLVEREVFSIEYIDHSEENLSAFAFSEKNAKTRFLII